MAEWVTMEQCNNCWRERGDEVPVEAIVLLDLYGKGGLEDVQTALPSSTPTDSLIVLN
jgi:hypothetical protein